MKHFVLTLKIVFFIVITRADLDTKTVIRWRLHFFLKRHARNYSTLQRSDIAAWAASLDPRLYYIMYIHLVMDTSYQRRIAYPGEDHLGYGAKSD